MLVDDEESGGRGRETILGGGERSAERSRKDLGVKTAETPLKHFGGEANKECKRKVVRP